MVGAAPTGDVGVWMAEATVGKQDPHSGSDMSARRESAAVQRVTVFIPGLTGGPQWPAPWPRSLARVLARAQKEDRLSAGFSERALDLFGLPHTAGLAALARLGEGQAADGRWWVRCDPVYLAVDGDRLLLVDNETLGLAADEAMRLSGLVGSVFAAEGGVIEVCAPTRWYLTLPAPEPLVVASLAEVTGHNVHDYLPTGNSRYWRTRLNEAQMLLHQALIGTHGGEGLGVCVNSVWFWGPGRIAATTARSFSQVYTDDTLLAGAARATQTACAPVPSGPDDLDSRGHVLVVLRGAQGSVQYGDTEGWSAFLETVATSWLQPLTEQLARGAISELVVSGDHGPLFRLTRRDRWRFWRGWR